MVMVSDYRLVKIWNSPQFPDEYRNGLLKVFGVSLEMSSDLKKYFVDEFTELVYTVKLRYRHNHLWDCRSRSQMG